MDLVDVEVKLAKFAEHPKRLVEISKQLVEELRAMFDDAAEKRAFHMETLEMLYAIFQMRGEISEEAELAEEIERYLGVRKRTEVQIRGTPSTRGLSFETFRLQPAEAAEAVIMLGRATMAELIKLRREAAEAGLKQKSTNGVY